MKNTGILVLALLLSMALCAPAFSATKHDQHETPGAQPAEAVQGGEGDTASPEAEAAEKAANQEKFLAETAELRREVVLDETELQAVLSGQNPDPASARALRAKIYDNQQKIQEIAKKYNVETGGCPMMQGKGMGMGMMQMKGKCMMRMHGKKDGQGADGDAHAGHGSDG